MTMTEYKKSSVIMVFNDKGELALQLRAANDDAFPLHWDFSAAGGIDEGENEKASAERELQEELGITANVQFVAQEHLEYPSWNPAITRKTDLFIYKAHHNGPFKPDPKEVERVEFFSLDKIKNMIESGDKFHPEPALLWKKGLITRVASR
jgi:isopentenyldiphosphate isomerase